MLPSTKCIYQQWYAGILVTILIFEFGLITGWSSPTLPRLMVPEAKIHLNPEQASWVASLIYFGNLLGGVSGAILANYFGSKKTIFIALITIGIQWLLMILASSVEWLYAARLTAGFSLGIIFNILPLFLGEVSMPQIRGALISLASVGSPVGRVTASICGAYLSIQTAASIYFAILIVLMVGFSFIPDSPHYLMKIGNHEGARKSINWYRAGRGVEEELNEVEKFVSSNNSNSFKEKLREIKRPAVRKSTIQIIVLFVLMQFSGINIIIAYMESILRRANFCLINPADVVIYVNTSSIFASIFSIFLVDKCGRKFLLIISSSGVSISTIALSVYFLFFKAEIDTSNMQWIPVASMFLLMLMFHLGLLSVPTTLLSELLPADIKCIVFGTTSCITAIAAFVSTKTYYSMIDFMSEAYVLLIYAIVTALVVPYTLFAVQETKGKSLQQIQEESVKK